jgi:hypothetical protein
MNAHAPIGGLRPLPIVDDEAPGVVASPERIAAWAKAANAGDRFVYATRAYLVPGSAGAKMARVLSDAGIVFLTQRRSGTFLTEFSYTATRSSKPWSEPKAVEAKPVLAARVNRAAEAADYAAGEMLLPILERAAQFGRPCPTDKQLAAKARMPTERVAPGLDALRASHAITVHPCAAPTLRIVTILSSGARTGYARTGEKPA